MYRSKNLYPSENKKIDQKYLFSPIPKIKVAKSQTTISKKISFSGVGLHSGNSVKMTIKPSNEQDGIKFRLLSKNKSTFSDIYANHKNVFSTFLCTTLSDTKGNKISTTEHILAAIYALGIDNLIIELDSNEIPIMDGSSKQFFQSLKKIKLVRQPSFKKYVKILRKISVSDNDSHAEVLPNDDMIVSCKLNFKSKIIGNQSISFILSPKIFESEISEARTFGFLEDISHLRSKGLTLGGSLKNAIVISDNKILNTEGLRFSDEFVRHKALDLIGDLSLSGHPMLGSFSSYKGGHKLNYLLLNKIFSSKHNWEFVDSNLNPIF